MRNFVDLRNAVPSMVGHLLGAIAAYESEKWERSQDIKTKKNEGKQITFR